MKPVPLKNDMTQLKRVQNAEKSCRNAETDWAKNYWFNVFKTLCKKYKMMEYFRKVIH